MHYVRKSVGWAIKQVAVKLFLKKIKSRVFYKKKTLILRIEIRTRTDGAGWDITRQIKYG